VLQKCEFSPQLFTRALLKTLTLSAEFIFKRVLWVADVKSCIQKVTSGKKKNKPTVIYGSHLDFFSLETLRKKLWAEIF
jgi:hypothetical protein